jgi:predicted dehydrogenase
MPVNICLIGAGHMGKIHAQKLAGMRDARLRCVVDANEAQACAVSGAHGVPAVVDYSEVCNGGMEGAVIASPTETHYRIARDLLQNGIHVFIEKPLAATPEEARELIGLAKNKRLILQVGHLERFSPPFRRASGLIRNPLLIEAHRISGFTGRSTDIDVIHDLMIHDIDLVLSLARSQVRKIWAQGTPVLTHKIDVASARIEFESGCIAMISASRVSTVKERVFRVYEKDAYFSLDLGKGKLFSVRKNPDGTLRKHTYLAARPDPVKDELRAFIRAIREKATPAVDGEDGLNALLLANRIKARIDHTLAEKETRTV